MGARHAESSGMIWAFLVGGILLVPTVVLAANRKSSLALPLVPGGVFQQFSCVLAASSLRERRRWRIGWVASWLVGWPVGRHGWKS